MAGRYISAVVNWRQCALHFHAFHTRLNEVFGLWNLLQLRVVFALRSGLFAVHCLSKKYMAAEVG